MKTAYFYYFGAALFKPAGGFAVAATVLLPSLALAVLGWRWTPGGKIAAY